MTKVEIRSIYPKGEGTYRVSYRYKKRWFWRYDWHYASEADVVDEVALRRWLVSRGVLDIDRQNKGSHLIGTTFSDSPEGQAFAALQDK